MPTIFLDYRPSLSIRSALNAKNPFSAVVFSFSADFGLLFVPSHALQMSEVDRRSPQHNQRNVYGLGNLEGRSKEEIKLPSIRKSP